MSSNNVTSQAIDNKKITRDDLKKIFWRSLPYNASFKYERQLNMGWAYTLVPVLKKLYGDDDEKMKDALNRHLEYNNITPFISTFLFGLIVAMEEKNANSEDFDTKTISATKAGLMGPLSAIGDSIFFGTIRVIAASIGCSLALKGNPLGPILYLLIFNIPNLWCRWTLVFKGYDMGVDFLTNVEKSGAMDRLFLGSSILGLMVIGGMIALNMNIPLTVNFFGTSLVDVINGIIPCLVNLLFFGLIYWLVKKNCNVVWIMLGIIALGILGSFVGVF